MNLFEVISNLYTKKDCKWINDITEDEFKDYHPIIVNKFLSMNKQCLDICNKLNKYSFSLQPREFLLLAWSQLPKYSVAPFCKYIKEQKQEDEFEFVWVKLKKRYNYKGQCFNNSKKFLEKHFKENKLLWFKTLGVEEKYWKKYKIDLNPKVEKPKPVGLDAWF